MPHFCMTQFCEGFVKASVRISQRITHLSPWKGDGTTCSGCHLQAIERERSLGVVNVEKCPFHQGEITSLVAFSDVITSWVDGGRAVEVVYLDFSKAFKCEGLNFRIYYKISQKK